jgi:hypothetical protein
MIDTEKTLQQNILEQIGKNTISNIIIPDYISNNLKCDLWE